MNQPESSTRAIAASSSRPQRAPRAPGSPRRGRERALTGSAPGARGRRRPSAPGPRAGATCGAQPSGLRILRDVGVEVADVDALALGREGHERAGAPARDLDQQLAPARASETGRSSPEVEDLPVRGVARPRAQERVHHVVDVVEVALLRPVAEDLDLLAERGLAHEPADEALAVVADELARAVGVGEPQRARRGCRTPGGRRGGRTRRRSC